MEKTKMANTIIDEFFAALASGRAEAVLKLVAPDAIFEAQGPPSVPIYGRFEGHDGVHRFIATLGELFDTERFEIRQATQSGDIAFAYGYMQHRVQGTGQLFRSEWALYCEVHDGRIRTYKMFEDTAALAAAYKGITASIDSDRFTSGLAKLKEIDREAGEQVIDALKDIAPDLARYTIEFPFGDIYQRPGLDLRSREIATVAALTALGTAQPQLKVHIHGALNVGCTRTEIVRSSFRWRYTQGFLPHSMVWPPPRRFLWSATPAGVQTNHDDNRDA